MDVDAERERISREIQQLERILDPCCSSLSVDVSESSLDSDSDAGQRPRFSVRAAVSALGPRSAAVRHAAGCSVCWAASPRSHISPCPLVPQAVLGGGPCSPSQVSEGSWPQLVGRPPA